MAPQNKRPNVSKAAVPAKKAKVEVTEDPMIAQLAPIIAALGSSEETVNCCDILRAALPHCLAEAPEQRHNFQAKMLDLTASALVGLDAAARTGLAEAQALADKLRNDVTVANSESEVSHTLAKTKKEQSDAKGAEVEAIKGNVDAAKLVVQGEMQKKETFLASKAALIAEHGAFQKMMEEMWQPLKACSFTGKEWRKRDKACSDLFEKLAPLSMEESLVEALEVALKLKLEQRSAFALKAFATADEVFEKHTATLAERIAGTATEEAACEKNVADAEEKLQEVKGQHAEQDKEYDELQNAWAEAETKAEEAKTAAKGLDADMEDATADVETCKTALEAALAVTASFAALRDGPAPVVQLPAAVETEVEMATADATSAMVVEPQAVAA